MSIAIHFGFSEEQFTTVFQGIVFFTAAVYILLTIIKAKRTGQALHLRWLVPLAVYTINQSVTYAIDSVYQVLNLAEPEPLNTITDIMDDVSLMAFLWALIVLWKIIRHTPELLKTPWISANETPAGVWPPAPKAP